MFKENIKYPKGVKCSIVLSFQEQLRTWSHGPSQVALSRSGIKLCRHEVVNSHTADAVWVVSESKDHCDHHGRTDNTIMRILELGRKFQKNLSKLLEKENGYRSSTAPKFQNNTLTKWNININIKENNIVFVLFKKWDMRCYYLSRKIPNYIS